MISVKLRVLTGLGSGWSNQASGRLSAESWSKLSEASEGSSKSFLSEVKTKSAIEIVGLAFSCEDLEVEVVETQLSCGDVAPSSARFRLGMMG